VVGATNPARRPHGSCCHARHCHHPRLWPVQRRLQVRVAKAPPPPERAPGGGSPVRLHPTALLPSIIESVTGTVAEVHSRTAVTAVRILPTKPTKARAGSKRLRRGKHLQRAGHCLQVCPSSYFEYNLNGKVTCAFVCLCGSGHAGATVYLHAAHARKKSIRDPKPPKSSVARWAAARARTQLNVA